MGKLARRKHTGTPQARREELERRMAVAISLPDIPMVPTALTRVPLPLVETTPPENLRGDIERALLANPTINAYLKAYHMGECTVLVTREYGLWHLSIAHHSRYPTWDEIAEAWYRTIPDAVNLTGALILPPLHEYVNCHQFCMQVHQLVN